VSFMKESKLESDCGLFISSQELTRIRESCQRRRAELEAAGAQPAAIIAPSSSQSTNGKLFNLNNLTELSASPPPSQTCQPTCGNSSRPRSLSFQWGN